MEQCIFINRAWKRNFSSSIYITVSRIAPIQIFFCSNRDLTINNELSPPMFSPCYSIINYFTKILVSIYPLYWILILWPALSHRRSFCIASNHTTTTWTPLLLYRVSRVKAHILTWNGVKYFISLSELWLPLLPVF